MASTEQARSGAPTAPMTESADPTRYVADPAPLGLAGFAMTTFVLSAFNAGLINTALEGVVLPLALFYGGLGQFMAGMWEFRRANTFGALAFTSYGAFWMSFAAYVRYILPNLGPSAASATGLYLLAWTIFTAYMCLAAVRVNGAVLGVFVFLTLTFLALTIAEFSGATSMGRIGGWLGLITALIAWYASFAGVTNSTWKRTIVPVFPLTRAGAA